MQPTIARVRGFNILDVVALLQNYRWAAEQELSEHLLAYLDERIHRYKWYPEEHFVQLYTALGRFMETEHENIWERLGQASANFIFEHRNPEIIRPYDPIATLRRVAGLWEQSHDTGYMKITSESEGRARIELIDYAFGSEEICRTSQGYFREVLEMTDATDVEVTLTRCQSTGDTDCSWTAKWTEPEDPSL